MKLNKEEFTKLLCDHITEEYGYASDGTVTADTRLDDLNMDSLDKVELESELSDGVIGEVVVNVTLTDAETIGDVVNLVAAAVELEG